MRFRSVLAPSVLVMMSAIACGPPRNPHRWATTGAVIHGKLLLEDIRKVFNENIGKIETCYGGSKITGRVMLHFVIDQDGRVTSSEVLRSATDLQTVATCTAQTVQQLRFPKPETSPVDVEYPLLFDPRPPPPLPPPAPPTPPKVPKAPKLPFG